MPTKYPVSHALQIGAAFAARRRKLKLSQTEVASRLSISQSRLSELESRPETLTVAQMLAIANMLGFEVILSDRQKVEAKLDW
jgi:HTH-type transcriptional regulator/antitoxin HipB